MGRKKKWKILNNYFAEKHIKEIMRDYNTTDEQARGIMHKIDEEQYIKLQEGINNLSKSLSTSQSEGTEFPLNPIPSQNDNKNNNGSGTKPSTRGI